MASARVLGSYVKKKHRQTGNRVTWVIAISKEKDIHEMLSALMKPLDNIVAVQYRKVEGMPWLEAAATDIILSAAEGLGLPKQQLFNTGTVQEALFLADQLAKGGPMVIAGSLYLASDVLRLLHKSRK